MIIYDLKCAGGHQFEGWFSSAEDYKEQSAMQMIACPVCDSLEVVKLPTASRVNTLSATRTAKGGRRQSGILRDQIERLHKYIEKNFENVGTEFAEEARRIHYGEAEARNIQGEATRQEVQELGEEGINAFPLPPKPINKDKLN